VMERHGVDLVLSDVKMPRLDGASLVHRLRARGDGIPVVLMSAVYAEVDLPVGDRNPVMGVALGSHDDLLDRRSMPGRGLTEGVAPVQLGLQGVGPLRRQELHRDWLDLPGSLDDRPASPIASRVGSRGRTCGR
jgi:CheY-like chemotaxis protein